MKVKLLTTLILSSLLFCCGQDNIRIHVINKTMDNIEINSVGGPHVSQDGKYHVMTLFKDLPYGSFKVCRGYGCLANVTVTVKFPESAKGDTPERYEEEFELTEDLPSIFGATKWGGHITNVTVTPLEY